MFVRLFVCALQGKPLELSTPNLVHVYSITVAQHAVTLRSNGQRLRLQGYQEHWAWVCMSIRLSMFTSYYFVFVGVYGDVQVI